MKTPFNIIIPPELPVWRKPLFLAWRVFLRLIGFIVLPIVSFFTALNFAWEEDSIGWFAENFWKSFSRLTWLTWHACAGYNTAAYYRLHRPTGGCGPYIWFKQRPEDPKDGSGDYWQAGIGY